MKRTITLFIIYISQIIFAICYYIKDIWNSIVSALPFMEYIADFLGVIVRYFKGWFNFDFFNNLPVMVQTIVVVVLLNIVFTIVFLIIFGLIAFIQTNNIRNELNNKANIKFTLSEEERAKFDWKLFEEKVPVRRILSLIVPIGFLCLFLLVRYDVEFCKSEDMYNEGFFNVYGSIKQYFFGITDIIEDIVSRYISFTNRINEATGLIWLEWVIVSISFLIICLLWWGFFSLFAKPFGESVAKAKADKAKRD